MPHHGVSAIRAFPVVFFLLFASQTLHAQRVVTVFPQFASGGGWSSDIFINNQGELEAVVDVSFFGDNGAELSVDSTLGVGSKFSFSLSGGNTKAVRVSSTGVLRTGYVVLSFPNGASVRASEVFRLEQNGVVITTLGVAQQFALPTFSFPAEVDVARGINTGIAIANGTFDTTAGTAQRCVVNLVKSDGTLQNTTTVNLGAGGHVSVFLNDTSLFPGLDGFSGTVIVSAARPIGLVALRQDHSVFGTVSVDGGPILTPFLLSTTPVSELEQNNSRATAQTIGGTTVIAGTIAFNGDVDYFQFTGKSGDVVTVVVSTANLNSALDSLLFLLNPDGTVFAENDENGLFFQHDSFLQAALPADGTYYLAVTDYNSGGGFNGTYRMHVQLLTPASK